MSGDSSFHYHTLFLKSQCAQNNPCWLSLYLPKGKPLPQPKKNLDWSYLHEIGLVSHPLFLLSFSSTELYYTALILLH